MNYNVFYSLFYEYLVNLFIFVQYLHVCAKHTNKR